MSEVRMPSFRKWLFIKDYKRYEKNGMTRDLWDRYGFDFNDYEKVRRYADGGWVGINGNVNSTETGEGNVDSYSGNLIGGAGNWSVGANANYTRYGDQNQYGYGVNVGYNGRKNNFNVTYNNNKSPEGTNRNVGVSYRHNF